MTATQLNVPELVIPAQPADPRDQWVMLWQGIDQLRLANELLQLELSCYKSQDERQKWAGQYAEEAVASLYGFDRLVFYGGRKLGKATANDNGLTEARFLLYTILHHVLGVTIPELRSYYDNNTRNYLDRWRPIFALVHGRAPIENARKRSEYAYYAPRYRAAYGTMQQAMQADGVWALKYTDSALPDPY